MQTRQTKNNKITTIIGHKGDGKSVLSECLVMLNSKPAILIDPQRTFPTESKRRIHFTKPKELLLWLYKTDNFKKFYQYRLELVCNATEDNFDFLSPIFQMRGVHIVIDEIDRFYTPTTTQKSPVYKLINFGRHLENDLTTSSRRPANISRNLTSQTDIFYFSQMKEPNDLKFFRDCIGKKELMEKVQRMRKYHFLRIDEKMDATIIRTDKNDIRILDETI